MRRSTSLHGHLASLRLPVWALVAWLIVLGAIVPVALVVAFLWLGESLGLFQLLGGGLVLSAIALAQSSR